VLCDKYLVELRLARAYDSDMSLLHEKAASNKKVMANKIDRTARSISGVIEREQDDGKNRVEIVGKHRPVGFGIGRLVTEVSTAVEEVHAADGWSLDREASEALGKITVNYGYGNADAQLWDKPAWVFVRQALAEVVQFPVEQLTPPGPEHLAA